MLWLGHESNLRRLSGYGFGTPREGFPWKWFSRESVLLTKPLPQEAPGLSAQREIEGGSNLLATTGPSDRDVRALNLGAETLNLGVDISLSRIMDKGLGVLGGEIS